ncbi:Conserved oligomeric Golgi complex subunit 3 [Amphibalanus amphitrite]|uniref:Conserved oligomeric Golgi complex subunit 3 n=2 Tax=Amphibalanus amphitrite TaxID=1232801 RepID=A0A6A4W754_AMPAM|nr:Conserved oligomeric Golgi complex subunit 3 [Amphibalanus amphitrite]
MASNVARSTDAEAANLDLLQNWDDTENPLAPLEESQRDAVIDLSVYAHDRPLPEELSVPELDDPRSPTTSVSEPDVVTSYQSPIDSTQQFFHWFSELEHDMISEEDFIYQSYTKQLQTYQKQCSDLLSQVETSLEQMRQLSGDYTTVSTKTNSLHDACEALLADQTKLSQQAELIENKLSYFLQLDKITKRLDSPTFSVTSEAFIPLLARLDECIQYMVTNPTYKDAAAYLARLRHCQWRALGMIRSYVTASLEQAAAAAAGHGAAAAAAPPTAEPGMALVYGKFRTNAARVKTLMEELEDRVDAQPEYQQLLADCHACYFRHRHQLVSPAVQAGIRQLAERHKRDHCALFRSGCAFLVHLCEDEYQLFFQFFTKPSPQINESLEGLCANLYDLLRPLIIHINHLETLAELCSILSVEMLEEHVSNNPVQLEAFGTTVRQLLQDVQERLVYRSHIYIRSDILNFRPSPGDLAYPEKLAMMQSIAESLQRQDSRGSVSSQLSHTSAGSEANGLPRSRTGNSPADLHGMWYPTVRRTLVCLSKLFRCTERSVFQGLSQEALAMCVQSLQNAAHSIAERKSLRDAQLFEIKHLLILREQIAPFHVDFSVREISLDLSKIKTAAMGLVQKRSQLFALNSSNALLEFLLEGTPAVQEHTRDSKREVDLQLKRVCEAFIRSTQSLLQQPVDSLILRAVLESAPDQPLPPAETVAAAVTESQRLIKTHLPEIHSSLQLYLANPETEFILFKPVKVGLLQRFQRLQDILLERYSDDDRMIVMCPSQEQLSVLLASCLKQPAPAAAATPVPAPGAASTAAPELPAVAHTAAS